MHSKNLTTPEATPKSRWQSFANHFLVASILSVALCYALAYLWSLMEFISFRGLFYDLVYIFIFAPFLLGLFSSYLFCYRRVVKYRAALGVGLLSLLFAIATPQIANRWNDASKLVAFLSDIRELATIVLTTFPIQAPAVALGCMAGLSLASFSRTH